MKKLVLVVCFLWLSGVVGAADLNGLVPIGPLSSYETSANNVTITCADQSQVRIYLLAPDLIRVRASFGEPLPTRDHSWAIAKTEWDAPKWTAREDSGNLLIS